MSDNKEVAKHAPPRPTITLPPRPSFDAFYGFSASPGPMTLVSSFFADPNSNNNIIINNNNNSNSFLESPDSCWSFSQLLAGAMNSPLALANSNTNNTNSFGKSSDFEDGSGESLCKDGDFGDGFEKNSSGFKKNKPLNIAIVRSPLFSVPPGLSPSGLLFSPGFFSPQSPFGMSHQQALAQVTAQAALTQSQMQMQPELEPPSTSPEETLTEQLSVVTTEASQMQMPPPASEPSIAESSDFSNSSHHQEALAPVVDKPADDGYNWRKYGQKQVKGSEFPRSYYKCTHLNCPVKKKVERSPEGRITEIIYRGQHNHEMPQSNRRAKDVGSFKGDTDPQVKPEVGWQHQAPSVDQSKETEYAEGRNDESVQAMQIYRTGSIDPEEVDGAEAGQEGNAVDDDEPDPKRRKDNKQLEVILSHKSITEPKIIVQTRSEVDLLDDGYRWRKYGQKVVKGNPHPRSYYKCTYAGCTVRKHVERAAADPKAVITTYEGKHNHSVPAARGSGTNAAVQVPQKVVAQKHPLFKGMDFENNQRPAVLQLKEEKIAV